MNRIMTLPFVLVVLAFQCNKDYGASTCINNKIAELKAKAKQNPPAEVNEYMYQGRKVYLFSADCCDQYNELYDANCNYICAPTGGITGNGDGKCSDFSSAAQFVRQVWKDDR